MSFARVNGGVLHWTVSGPADGQAVVFCNSLGSDFRIWDSCVAELSPQCRLIRYDKRGHGLSDVPAGAFGIDDHVDDLAGLLDYAAVGDCCLVSLSVGGMIAQRFAARLPERVRAVVLCGTAARIGTGESWTARIAAVRQGGIASIADAVLEGRLTRRFRAEWPDDLAGWRNMLVRTPVEGYLATCAAIRDADLSADAAAIAAPCLCLVGDEDGATPPDLVRRTAALIRGARFEVIEGAGHLPCLEQPARLGELIRQHLTEAGHA